jgi:tetratricopeptide (TPR) repeat protein
MSDAPFVRVLRQIRSLGVVITILLTIAVLCNIYSLRLWRNDQGTRSEFQHTVGKLMTGGKYSKALALAKQQKDTYPNDPYAWWYLGVAHYGLGSWQEAIAAFKKAEELAPVWHERVSAYVTKAQEKLDLESSRARAKKK